MQREIGRTGIRVFAVGLGAMPLSLRGRPDEETAIGVIRAALNAGVDFIDTANSYCVDQGDVGDNERLIAKALQRLGAAGRVTVATKGGLIRPGGAWEVDARPDALTRACEQSLRDLRVPAITLYQLHAPDRRVPYAESVGALARLQQAGKIQHIGLSNVTVAQIQAAQRLVRVESVQNRCNVADQEDLRNGVVRFCAEQGITYIPYSPVGGHHGHRGLARNKVVQEIARAHGVSPQRIMLAWLLAQGNHVLPIPGASKAASIQDSAGAVQVNLGAQERRHLDTL
jgi:aryl-alcohol dehydrogenase-like predicted oxidoreductase